MPPWIAHADWGSSPAKRWLCVGEPRRGRVHLHAPAPVGPLETLLARLTTRAGGAGVVLGVDFPVGLPAAYAARAGIDDFRAALARFGRGRWRDFYAVAASPEEVGLRRPFYPRRPGGTRRRQLVAGLGLPDDAALLRRCDHATPRRGPTSPLFWTLGAKQVGRAAILGWRDVLAPGLSDPARRLRLWPFDGDLADLVAAGAAGVVAETYPAEACVQLGLRPRPGLEQDVAGGPLGAGRDGDGAAAAAGVTLDAGLSSRLRSGFSPEDGGDDAFDAAVGALSMAAVVRGDRADGAPHDPAVRRLEGWILGLEA